MPRTAGNRQDAASFRTIFRTSPKRRSGNSGKLLKVLVGARGFEPPTPCAQGRCATGLRYAHRNQDLMPQDRFGRDCEIEVHSLSAAANSAANSCYNCFQWRVGVTSTVSSVNHLEGLGRILS